LTHIDNDNSTLIESLATLKPGRYDSEEVFDEKREKMERYRRLGACQATCGDTGNQKTLFINASIQGEGNDGDAHQLPWIVDIALPRG
jgi:hypothetical protein